jgi:hypothetical protein
MFILDIYLLNIYTRHLSFVHIFRCFHCFWNKCWKNKTKNKKKQKNIIQSKLKSEGTDPVDLADTAGGDGKGVNNLLPLGVEGDYFMI